MESLELYFREKGYVVNTATNGEVGLALIKDRQPQVAIVDLRLPGISGLELLQALKLEDIDCRSFWNSYRLDYWNRLLPTPLFFKRFVNNVLQKSGTYRLRLSMNVGNLMVVGRKP